MNSPIPAPNAESHPDLAPRHAAALLALLVLAGAALRVYHYEGFDHSDEMEYLRAASDLASGEYRFPEAGYGTHAWLRYTIVLPLALAIRCFGPDDRACAAPFFLSSLVTILVAYGIGRDLCRSRAAGMLMAILLALNARDVAWATRLYPDAVQSLFLALSMWFVSRSRPSETRPVSDSSPHMTPRSRREALLVGLCFALAYNSNLISVIFLPSLAAVLLLTHPWRRALRTAAWMLAGFAAIYGPYMIFLWIAAGTPFMEFTAITYAYAPNAEESNFGAVLGARSTRGLSRFWSEVWQRDFYHVLRILMTDGGFLAIARPAALCLAAGLFMRGRADHERWAWRVAAIWLVVLYVVYEFGTPFLPLRKVPRYLHMFIFPMAALIVVTLTPYVRRRAVAPGILLGLALAAIVYALPASRPPMGLTLAAGLAGIGAVALMLFARRTVMQALGIGIVTLTLLFECRNLGVGLSLHTQLSRAVQRLNLPHPVFTNSWRTKSLLRCLTLHDRGPDGVLHVCDAAPLMEAIDQGKAVVLYARPGPQYGHCDLSPEETQRILPIMEQRADKVFDSGLYRVFRGRNDDAQGIKAQP